MGVMQGMNWKEKAIEKSELISDGWDVFQIYAGKAARWVLFGCMVVSIVEILPMLTVPDVVVNVNLAVQAITLDVAGFGLWSMADHARENGDEKAANRAGVTAYILIGLMILTVSLITAGVLWSQIKGFTDGAEKVLILVRVVMTVVYGHVVHGLRKKGIVASRSVVVPDVLERLSEVEGRFTMQLAHVESSTRQLIEGLKLQSMAIEQQIEGTVHRLASNLEARIEGAEGRGMTMENFNVAFQPVREGLEQLAFLDGTLRQIEAVVERQAKVIEDAKLASKASGRTTARGHLKALPSSTERRQFVFDCLVEDEQMKLKDIKVRAKKAKLELSEASISLYRKAFFEEKLKRVEAQRVVEVGKIEEVVGVVEEEDGARVRVVEEEDGAEVEVVEEVIEAVPTESAVVEAVEVEAAEVEGPVVEAEVVAAKSVVEEAEKVVKVDKLALTLELMRTNAACTDGDLAQVLGLKKPASARFWRLKAQAMLEQEAASLECVNE